MESERMTHTLGMIVGSAYSGSTLLTALLDRHPDIAALGEAQKVYRLANEPASVCWDCKTPAADCSLWSRWDREQPFYQFAAAHTAAEVLLDSTKDPTLMLEQWHKANRYPLNPVAIFISKTPLEQVGSYHGHHAWRLPPGIPEAWNPEQCVAEWLCLNYWFFGYLMQNRIPIEFVTYSDLTKNTGDVVDRILTRLGVDPSASGPVEASHVIAGNPAVIGSVTGDVVGFGDAGREKYLAGKYADQPGGLDVVYDSSWEEMPPEFRERADAELDRRSAEVAPLLSLLGHSTAKA
jgi:hypothetical protein